MKYKWYALKLVLICAIIFFFQLNFPNLTDEFALISAEVFYKPWTIVTYIFLHGSVLHIVYNMFALGLFGSTLESIIGGKKFLILFFISGIVAGIGSVLFYNASIGASGAVYGIFGALAVLRPRMTVYMGYGFPMPLVLAVTLWAIGDFIGLFAPTEVAYAAHLFGLAFGLIYGFSLRKQFGEKKKRRTKVYDIGEKEFEDWENEWMFT